MISSAMKDAIGVCAIADHYAAMYDGLAKCQPMPVDLAQRHVSHALYYHLCKIKYAAWRHRVNFRRARRHSLADIFQDLVAFYLRAALPAEYAVCLEEPKRMQREDKTVTIQPDICIKRNGRVHFVVEAKTTIGWARPDFKLLGEAAYDKLQGRIDAIAQSFEVRKENVIFVFEEPTNVSTEHFLPQFWDVQAGVPVVRPTEGCLAHIYPLFMATDPYYWKWKEKVPKGVQPANWYPPEMPDQVILERAAKSVVTPFESVLSLIQASS